MNLLRRILSLLLIRKHFTAFIVDYGLIKVDLNSAEYIKITDATRLSGYRYEGKDRYDPDFLEETTIVKAQIERSFGISFYFLVNNSHREVNIEISTRILHPEMIHPITGQRAVSQTETFIYTTPYYQYMHVTFEHEYEMVSGLWIFQVWKGPVLMLEKNV